MMNNTEPGMSNVYLDNKVSIFDAAEFGDVKTLRLFLESGYSLNDVEDESEQNPIHIACFFGRNAFVQNALKLGPYDPWARDLSGRTALDYANARKSMKQSARLLYKMMYGHFSPIPDGIKPEMI